MFDDVNIRLAKKNQILFTRESKSLKELRTLISEQKHSTLILWIFDIINVPISELKALYPHLTIFDEALIKVKQWAHGEIKMPVAKQAILECHAVSKTIDNKHDIALIHAVGQGLSTVHVETHALGLVFYELTALVYANEDYEDVILKKINFYIERLNYIKNNETKLSWAPFIIKDKPNKERLLILKETT